MQASEAGSIQASSLIDRHLITESAPQLVFKESTNLIEETSASALSFLPSSPHHKILDSSCQWISMRCYPFKPLQTSGVFLYIMEEAFIVSILDKLIFGLLLITQIAEHFHLWEVQVLSADRSHNGVREPWMCKWERLSHLMLWVLVEPKMNDKRHLSVCCICERRRLRWMTNAISHYDIIAFMGHKMTVDRVGPSFQ